jgi:glycosyltransferase involved in cell wall biosynthesis
MWPSVIRPYYGIFVKEQVESLMTASKGYRFSVLNIVGYRSKFNYLMSIWNVRSALKKNQIDLIHVHFGLSGLFLLANLKINCPVVCTLHGSDVSRQSKKYLIKWLTRKIVKKSTKLILVNSKMSAEIEDLKKPYSVIPCGVDMDFFKPILIERKKNGESLIIGFPSSPVRAEKNYSLFKKIVELVQLKHPSLKLEIRLFVNLNRLELLNALNEIDILLMTSNTCSAVPANKKY